MRSNAKENEDTHVIVFLLFYLYHLMRKVEIVLKSFYLLLGRIHLRKKERPLSKKQRDKLAATCECISVEIRSK